MDILLFPLVFGFIGAALLGYGVLTVQRRNFFIRSSEITGLPALAIGLTCIVVGLICVILMVVVIVNSRV